VVYPKLVSEHFPTGNYGIPGLVCYVYSKNDQVNNNCCCCCCCCCRYYYYKSTNYSDALVKLHGHLTYQIQKKRW